MKKIFLNNTVIKNLHLDNYDIAVYVALRSLYDSKMDSKVVTFNMIAYTLILAMAICINNLLRFKYRIILYNTGFCCPTPIRKCI